MRSTSFASCVVAGLALASCGEAPPAIVDAAIVDGAGGDGAVVDATEVDAAVVDATAIDAVEIDAAAIDAAEIDAAAIDAAESDAAAIDATAIVDAAPLPDADPCPVGLDETVPAVLAITTDDNTKVWLNGVLIDDTPRLWSSPQRYDVTVFAHPAHANVLAIEGVNLQNQAGYDRGIVADLRFTAGGAPQVIVTDAATRATNTLTAGWERPGFDDRAWPAAVPLGAVGIAPWFAVFASIAPGSTAQWIWTYDPAAVVDKPTVESTYARRTFAAVDPRCGPVVVSSR